MSKKMRIAISCILAVLAFGLGIAVYARENGNKAEIATADSEAVYFVNAEGKITVPTEPAATTDAERLANKVNRGRSADNPFFVLEIVPYDMWAEFGYKIAGCEPIDMEIASWYGSALPSGMSLPMENYTAEDRVYEYWEADVPDNFPTSVSSFENHTDQYGVMKQVTDNSGNYTKDGYEYVKHSELPDEIKDAYAGARYKLDGTSYVEDEAGEYIQRDKFKKVENGDYLWTPLTPTECVTIKNSNLFSPYKYSLHVPDESGEFLCYFENVKFYQTTNGKKYTHNNIFVLESVGLAYKMVDGVRVDIRTDGSAAEKAQMWADVEEFSKNCIVYTVTPEELNINLGLIDRADMIYIKGTASDSGIIKFNESYGRKDRFEHATTAIATREKNKSTADFNTNPLDWAATVKIYEAVTNDLKPVPLIMDTAAYNTNTSASANVPIVYHDYETDSKGRNGSANNIYKLFLMLHQMPNSVFESFYGSPADTSKGIFTSKNMSSTPGNPNSSKNRDGSTIQIGVINFDKIPHIAAKSSAVNYVKGSTYSSAKEIWNAFTLLPWEIVPSANKGSYTTFFGALEIKSDWGDFQFDGGGAQDSIQDGMYLYCGSSAMNDDFATLAVLDNDQYGYAVFDYFESIGDPQTEICSAEVLYYLLNGLRNSSGPGALTNSNYKILEIQPSPMYVDGVGEDDKYIISGPSDYWTTFITSYTNTTGTVEVDRITTKELIGKNVEFLSEYDLIYVGLNKDSNDVTMTYSKAYSHKQEGANLRIETKSSDAFNFIYAHTGPRVTIKTYNTSNSGSSSLFGWLYTRTDITKKLTEKTDIEGQFVYSGNDITKRVLTKLEQYGAKGYPILFADGFFDTTSPANKDDIAGTIDHNSYIFDMASKIGSDNYLYMGSLSTGTTHGEEAAKLRNALRKSIEVQWTDMDLPKLYDLDATDYDKVADDSDYLSGQTLQFEFTLKAPTDQKYRVVLSTDLNGDGKYTSDEIIMSGANFYIKKVVGGSTSTISNGTLEGGYRYRVIREKVERVGSVSWKLDLVEVKADGSNGRIMQSESGVSAIKASVGNSDADGADKRVTIKVLQVLSKERQQVYLPMDGEVSGDTVNISGLTDEQKEKTKWFYQDTKDLKDFKIQFVRTTIGDLETKIVGNEDYLTDEGFDMVVLGFADAYVGITSNTILDAIENFRLKGKAILYTHDNSSMVGYGVTDLQKNCTWGKELTLRFRDAFGMDRYDVLGYKADATKKTLKTETTEGRADIPYAPSSTSDGGTVMTADGGSGYMLVQGLTDGILYRHMEVADKDTNLRVKRISNVNKGGISQYPYTIPDAITVAETHPQYYQLDLETDDIVVWYTLGDQNYEGDSSIKENGTPSNTDVTVDKYYASTPKDVRNNYYIYNIDNVTYSGMGHSGGMSREEVRLFINTFIAAYRPSAKSATVQIENEEVSGDNSGYYLLVDVDPQEGDKLRLINDAQDTYYEQKVVGGDYVLGDEKADDSKRVYFRINDGSLLPIRMYDITFKVDGVAKELAVFRKSTGTYIRSRYDDVKGYVSQIDESTYDDIFYVDVPITLEDVATEGGGTDHAVVDTSLEITIKARYKLKPSATWLEADSKKVNVTITPRGLFDLD